MILSCQSICKSFGEKVILQDASFHIEEREKAALIGNNGAGKTTVFNLLTGVYRPTSGEFFFDGQEIKKSTPVLLNKLGIARTFQNIRLFNELSVLDNVRVGFSNSIKYNMFEGICRVGRYRQQEKEYKKKAMELLEVFDLDKESRVIASNLPYGKQRKLEIARAMATNPKLLLLDEPAAGMNPNETAELMETIRFVRDKFDMTILLIEHDMKLVSGICEELTVLNFGTVLAQGKTTDVLNDPKVITAYIGEDD